MSAHRTIGRLLAILRRRQIERELADDIAAHLELAERDALARGLSPEQAHRAARLSFGGVEQVKEAHRDQRGFGWIETLFRDLRYGLASLARTPGFTAVVVGVLALGIGANVAMFGIVDAVLFRPLPFPAPDRIVRVWEAPRPGGLNATSAPDFLDWKRLATVFDATAAERPISAAVTGSGEPVRLPGKAVTSEYFRVFGVRARLGRTFLPQEDRSGATPVIVLSHAAWQNEFGGDPGILRRRLVLDGEPHEVIGVLAPGAFDRDETRFWKPLFVPAAASRELHWLTVYGRLRGGITLPQARDEMARVHTALLDVTPVRNRDWTIVVEPLARMLVGENLRRSVAVAFGAVALVLLIACANVTNLLLARGAGRTKELAVRAALGAGRGRLGAQLLTESLVLYLLGAAAGIAAAAGLIRAATPLLAESLPFTSAVGIDPRVLAFSAAIALGAALLSGVLPALRTSFGNLVESLNQSARGSSSGAHARVRRAIVVGEVALSLVLVSGALLLLRSLLKLQQIETGVRIENVLTMSVDLPAAAYPTPEKAALFYEAVAQRLQSAPGVTKAGIATHLPLNWIGNGEMLQVPGTDERINVRYKRVDPGYFSTLGITLRAGRGIATRDTLGAPRVLVINEALAARLAEVARIGNPVGKVVRVTGTTYPEREMVIPEFEIAGVIRSERVAPPGYSDPPVVYLPLAQAPAGTVRFVVAAQSDAASVMPGIREAVREVDPHIALGNIATMQQVRDNALSGTSRPAWVIGAFAAIAVLLAAIGLYGVLAHAVAQRRREIGIRMALGARSRDVLWQVLGNAMSMVLIGLLLGLAGTLAITRVMKNLLFEVSPLDPLALAIACLSMSLVGLLAGFLPASRAARVDPVTTLQDEG